MRLAFEQYMMGGNVNASTSTSYNEPSLEQQEEEKERERQLVIHQRQQQMKKAEKKYWQIFDKFQRIVQQEWFDLDDQAYQVVQALDGLRNRLPMHMKLLKGLQQDRFRNNVDSDGKCWRNHGFHHSFYSHRSITSSNPFLEDVRNALSHDIVQHEKMLAALRSLFASLSECHEMILRILDQITKHHLECMDEFLDVKFKFEPSFLKAVGSCSTMRNIIAMLTKELYRKQCMVHMILNSVDNELFENIGSHGGRDGTDSASGNWEDMSPKDVVQRCCAWWPRESKYSCVQNAGLFSKQ